MCGRFSLVANPGELAEMAGIPELEDFPPRYNIAPTQPVLTIGNNPAGNRDAQLVRWGLIPNWVKDPADFTLLINARAETAAEKPSFRTAMRHGRVLIPASGFYEWHRPVNKQQPKQAYWIRPREGAIVFFAGLSETWMGKDGSEMDTACILTTHANQQIGAIHHRMPVIIKPDDFERWLDFKSNGPKDIADLLEPIEEGYFEAIAVSDAVNKVSNASPEIQKPMENTPVPDKKIDKDMPDDGQMTLF